MTIIVEDGTGRPDAESYASVDQLMAYSAARGLSWPDNATATQEQALRMATDYMAGYALQWSGYKVNPFQALDWPRYEVPIIGAVSFGNYAAYWPYNAVPAPVVNACIELAIRAASSPLVQDLGQAIKRDKTDVLETEYFEGSSRQVQYVAVERMLAPLMGGGVGNTIRVVRC